MCTKHRKYDLYNILSTKSFIVLFPYLTMNVLMVAGVALALTRHKIPRLFASHNNAFHISSSCKIKIYSI